MSTAQSPMLPLAFTVLLFLACTCAALFCLILYGAERHLVGKWDPDTFGYGLVVVRAVIDLEELGSRIVLPALGETCRTRSAVFRMMARDRGLFVARPPVRSANLVFVNYRSIGGLKGTLHLRGSILSAEGRMSPWLLGFLGSLTIGWLAGVLITASMFGLLLALCCLVALGYPAFISQTWTRWAKEDAREAIADISAILTERHDLARADPDTA